MITTINEFKNTINETTHYKSHDMSNHIITNDDAKKLYSLEEDQLGPLDTLSDDDFNTFMDDVVGKTLSDYAEWRWPDEPQNQFDMALEVLKIYESYTDDVDNYYKNQFSRLKNTPHTLKILDNSGNKTNFITLNKESIEALEIYLNDLKTKI